MKRFYKQVDVTQVDGGSETAWQVTLDTRGIKTARGVPQAVPTRPLAEALAAEWDRQGETIDPASFAYRDMADYAIDVVTPAPDAAIEKLLGYGETDTLLYRADPDEPLYARQQDLWEPITSDFEAREGVKLVRVSGVMHRAQEDATIAALRDRLGQLDAFTLAGTEMMASLAASLVIALLAQDAPGEDEALALWQAASLEEEWQADLWGRDEEAEQRRAKRGADFLAAYGFVQLASGN